MRKKDKITISVVAIVFVMVIGVWGLDFISEYLTVTQARENAADYIGLPVQITGNVKQDTLLINDTETNFILTDGVSDIEIFYHGDRPTTLAEGAKVSVKGILVSEDEVDANFLVMGCPSKYGI